MMPIQESAVWPGFEAVPLRGQQRARQGIRGQPFHLGQLRGNQRSVRMERPQWRNGKFVLQRVHLSQNAATGLAGSAGRLPI